jgi:hypothetical protein
MLHIFTKNRYFVWLIIQPAFDNPGGNKAKWVSSLEKDFT